MDTVVYDGTHEIVANTKRRAMAQSLGCHVRYAAWPHPDIWDAETALHGALSRLHFTHPPRNDRLMREFRTFVDSVLEDEIFQQLPAEADLTVETWLSNNKGYSSKRKAELLAAHESYLPKKARTDSFIKDEFYNKFKPARSINARVDAAKTVTGPVIALAEKLHKHLPFLVKGMSSEERANLMRKKFASISPNWVYLITDFSRFESCIDHEMAEACEIKFLKKFLRLHPEHLENILKLCYSYESDVTKFKWFKLLRSDCRKSGDSITSFGNALTNFLLFAFVAEKNGLDWRDLDALFEGDDGIATVPSTFDVSYYGALGTTLKESKFTELEDTDFCQEIFSLEDCVTLTDPSKVLLKFGWSKAHHVGMRKGRLMEILRAKSFSLAYQYAGCPIVSSLAQYGLRVTAGTDMRRLLTRGRLDWYDRTILLKAMEYGYQQLKKPVGFDSRRLVHKRFGISPDQQMAIETHLDNLTKLQPDRKSVV